MCLLPRDLFRLALERDKRRRESFEAGQEPLDTLTLKEVRVVDDATVEASLGNSRQLE